MLSDEYQSGGLWLRRWSLVEGWPRCVEDAVPADHPDAATIRADNARVREAVAAVLAYEAAQITVARVEAAGLPSETVMAPSPAGGEMVERANPAWVSYQAALATIAAADQTVLALALLRSIAVGTVTSDVPGYDAAVAAVEALGAS